MAVNITYRETGAIVPGSTTIKGTPLANTEIDGNFKSIKDAVELIQGDNGSAEVGYTPAGTGAVPRTVYAKLLDMAVSAKEYGLVGDRVTNDQAAMNALMASSHKVIRFPKGIYRAYMNNDQSDRTFIFDEGAIIDGTIHLAVGSGPDIGGNPTINWVQNIRVIGTCASTVRVGTYYARKVNIDKIRITETSSSYFNQTTEGGSCGVHFYCGSHDFEVGEIVCDSATQTAYALGVDVATTIDANHKPTNIHIGKLTVKNCTRSGISTNATVKLAIDLVDIQSTDTYGGCVFTADEDLRIGRIRVNGTTNSAVVDGIYVLNGISAYFDDVEVWGFRQIGFRTYNCGRVDGRRIYSHNNTLDQVRIESPGRFDEILAKDTTTPSGEGTGWALRIQGGAGGLHINKAITDDCQAGGVYVSGVSDVSIDDIKTSNCPLYYGLFLESTTRFRNKYIESHNNSQGIRAVGATNTDFGVLDVHDNAYGFVGASLTGFSYLFARWSNNTNYDTNTTFETISGFKGKMLRASVGGDRGDASVTLTVGTDAVTQRFATPLTSNRTVTLSTTGAANGDRFRIVRLASSTGASTLTVAAKALAVGQWCDVEFEGSAWQVSAYGSL